MIEIKLVKPTMEYANDIMSFRQEVLDANNSFAGCGSLKIAHLQINGLKSLIIWKMKKPALKVG